MYRIVEIIFSFRFLDVEIDFIGEGIERREIIDIMSFDFDIVMDILGVVFGE